MDVGFDDKDEARQAVWDALEDRGLARFPFPPHGRIPNFEDADEAARRAVEAPPLAAADRVKVNPDAPQRPLRTALLDRGVTVLVPTPRLRGGFKRLDPAGIPGDATGAAASLSSMDDWADPVPLDELPTVDAIVAGSVAVTLAGRRVGKGEGYSDLEYAILRELGHPHAPVVTTVHPVQVVDALPRGATDVPLSAVVTPETVHEVPDSPAPPEGVDWAALPEERIEAMPVLERLRERSA